MSAPMIVFRRCTTLLMLAMLIALQAGVARAHDLTDERDPLSRFNRPMFWFNDQVDQYVLEPVAKGWNAVLPKRVQRCISNFFDNLRFPIYLANNLLQAKFEPAAVDVARFMANTTFGLGGLFDPASDWELQRSNEDFGQTLGAWGVPPGPYLVWPLLGPSNPRDTVGYVADSFGTGYTYLVPWYVVMGGQGVQVVNGRAQVLTEVRELKLASVDYYVAVRNAYLQRREALVSDRAGMSEEEQEDLYKIDEGE